MGVGAPELLILLFAVVFLVVIIAGIVDAARRPVWAFERAGQSKVLWIVLQVIGLLLSLVGLILAIVYLTVIRPKVAAAQAGASWQAGPPPGGPPPGWWQASDGRWYPPQGASADRPPPPPPS